MWDMMRHFILAQRRTFFIKSLIMMLRYFMHRFGWMHIMACHKIFKNKTHDYSWKKSVLLKLWTVNQTEKKIFLVTWHGKGYINIIASNTMADGMLQKTKTNIVCSYLIYWYDSILRTRLHKIVKLVALFFSKIWHNETEIILNQKLNINTSSSSFLLWKDQYGIIIGGSAFL